ncbi:MAG: hypothetical protein PWQ67_2655 [Clostridia bacterium]|jgi:putative sporulation protein YtaF|nr:hypothetical protein [Clostridia bacterium]
MSVFSLILVATAVSIDGFWGGFSFGLRKIRISVLSLFIISSWSIICSMLTMLLGYNLQRYISLELGKYIGAMLLLFLGLFTLKEGLDQRKEIKNGQRNKIKVNFKDLVKILNNPLLADIDHENDIKPFEGTILGIAVAMDASIAAFTLSFFGFSPYSTPILFGLTHCILIGLGNTLARKNVINRLGEKFALLPGIILITLALLRFA